MRKISCGDAKQDDESEEANRSGDPRGEMETYNRGQGSWTARGIMRSACKQRSQGALLKQQEKVMGRKEEDSGWMEQGSTKWERKHRAVQKQRRSWKRKWRETV